MFAQIPRVFISCSHKDAAWKDRVIVHFGVLSQEGKLEIWDVHHAASLGMAGLPTAPRFERELEQLKLHFDLWFQEYRTTFSSSDRHSVVYLDDLLVPNIAFPSGIDRTVQKLIDELGGTAAR